MIMKAHTIDDPALILGLQDEIRRSDEARYDHRLHAVLAIAHGMKCREVSAFLGDSSRTIQSWMKRFQEEGLAGLADADRPGRPRRLTAAQMEMIGGALRRSPDDSGMSGGVWDGKMLSAYISREFRMDIGVRQCQRLFRQLEFRLRKPRPSLARADQKAQEVYKKTARD